MAVKIGMQNQGAAAFPARSKRRMVPQAGSNQRDKAWCRTKPRHAFRHHAL